MKWFDADIGSTDAALQQAPKVFQAVSVDLPVHVLNGVIHNLMRILAFKAAVGQQGVGIECSTSLNMLLNFPLQCALAAIRHYHGADFPAALKDAHNSGFILVPSAGNPTTAL